MRYSIPLTLTGLTCPKTCGVNGSSPLRKRLTLSPCFAWPCTGGFISLKPLSAYLRSFPAVPVGGLLCYAFLPACSTFCARLLFSQYFPLVLLCVPALSSTLVTSEHYAKQPQGRCRNICPVALLITIHFPISTHAPLTKRDHFYVVRDLVISIQPIRLYKSSIVAPHRQGRSAVSSIVIGHCLNSYQ